MVRFEFDDARLTVLPTGSLRLDGGAMFGVVPKPLWEREHEADHRNRILLAMNVLLVEDGHRRILIDTGAGEKWTDKERDIYGLETSPAEDWLKPAGLTPSDIDLVICSHLHFDHAGGNTVRDRDNVPQAAFPNAVYVIQQGELELARGGNERTRASYMVENYEPLIQAGQVRLVDGDSALTRSITLRLAPGTLPTCRSPWSWPAGTLSPTWPTWFPPQAMCACPTSWGTTWNRWPHWPPSKLSSARRPGATGAWCSNMTRCCRWAGWWKRKAV